MLLKVQSVLLWLLLGTGIVFGSTQAVARQVLPNHVPWQIKGIAPLGPLNATNRLRLAISLPLRHPEELKQLLDEIYDPESPKFHKYLSAEEFAQRFGPDPADYAALSAFLRNNGFEVTGTHPNRTILDVAGSVATIERIFHTKLQVYQHPGEKRTFYAPINEPALDLKIPILHIQGLDDLNRPRPLHKKVPVEKVTKPTPNAGSGSNGMYLGGDFRTAYVPGVTLTGSNQSVALVEFDGYYASDITKYEQQAGLSPVPLQNVYINGFNGQPGSGNGEVALDIQMAMAMAPGLAKILVYESSPYGSSYDILNRIATDNAARQISCSWIWGTYDSGTDQIFQQYATQGQSFFQASGDDGGYVGTVDAPADNPYITVVGGTTLSTDSQGAWAGEIVWNNGYGSAPGGGSSTIYPLPSWQAGINMNANLGSTNARNLPDIAMVADNVLSISDNGQVYQVTGTSIAAPLWAGLIALVNQKGTSQGQASVGFVNPSLYLIGKGPNYLRAFHDIAIGDSTTFSSPYAFYAVAGYDLCTGWGTPMGSNTINAILQVAHHQVDQFAWGSMPALVLNQQPFAVSLTARTIGTTIVSNFTGPVNISAFQSQTNTLFSRDFETGTLSDWTNEGGPFIITIDSSTGANGTTRSLSISGGDGVNSYNGLSHSLPNLTPDWFEFYIKSRSNNCASGYVVAGRSKYRTNSVFHFRLDTTGQMGLTDGEAVNFYGVPYAANQWYKISLHLNWGAKLVDYYVNSNLVFANIPFCNTNLTSLAVVNLYNIENTQSWWDQIRLSSASNSSIALSPTSSTSFTNGMWSGMAIASQNGTNIFLQASDNSGHAGVSAPFTVQPVIVMVSVTADPIGAGMVTGGGSYPSGSQQVLTATPQTGWSFLQWQDGSAQNPRTITVPVTNVTYTAFFAVRPSFSATNLTKSNNVFTATLLGASGSNYVIQVSTNLITWSILATQYLNGGTAVFIDTNAVAPYRFYRMSGTP